MRVDLQTQLDRNIRNRYKVYTEAQVAENANTEIPKTVSDRFIPSAAIYGSDFGANNVFISEQFARANNRDAISTPELLKWLKCPIAGIAESLEVLKAKQLTLVLIGYGGFGINTLHYLNELCLLTGVHNIFKHLSIIEDDSLTFSNILRISMDIDAVGCKSMDTPSKLELFRDEIYDGVLCDDIALVAERFDTSMVTEVYDNIPNTVYLGAPDFETRKLLEERKFIFGGHSNNDLVYISRPVVDADITVESYGTINLNAFFLNMLRGAVELPKLLLIDELPKDELIYRYNVTEEKLKVPKAYNLEFGE